MKLFKFSFVFIMVLSCITDSLLALPFNDDMVENQISTGQIVRPKPEGSVPVGSLKNKVRNKEEAKMLTNPVQADEASVFRGSMLYQSNCYACHGNIAPEEHQASPAGKFMGAPNIAMEFYKSRTDGEIYSTIHFGNIIMQPVGWKLSASETWDIVNYIRSKQNQK